jgi:hypothetical protein
MLRSTFTTIFRGFMSRYTKTNTATQKRYENELLGIHVHINTPPAESTNHGTARQRNQSALRKHLPRTLQNTLWPDFTRTGTPGTHAHNR